MATTSRTTAPLGLLSLTQLPPESKRTGQWERDGWRARRRRCRSTPASRKLHRCRTSRTLARSPEVRWGRHRTSLPVTDYVRRRTDSTTQAA